MENKKGAEMTIGTIIFIVLGVLVLVFLIWGFSTGWGNLWSKITSFTGGSANVDTVKQACALACSSNSVYDYCENVRTVTLSGGTKLRGTCDNFKSDGQVNVGSCDSIISCENPYKRTCEDLGGDWQTDACDGDTGVSGTPSDADSHVGENCCKK